MSELTIQDITPTMLTPIQEKAVSLLYNDVKDIIKSITEVPTTNFIVTISKVIGEVMTLVEAVSATKVPLAGADKKMVVITVIRKVIHDVISDEEVRAKILDIFNDIADSTIDIMITVSRGLQAAKKVEEVVSVCCSFLPKN